MAKLEFEVKRPDNVYYGIKVPTSCRQKTSFFNKCRTKMRQAAKEMRFEDATEWRDKMRQFQ